MAPAAALLHLQCELDPALQPALERYWDESHYAELLSLPGFLWARRGHLLAPEGAAPIVTMYRLSDPAAADQPRPSSFTPLPPELTGNVTFRRRIMSRISGDSTAFESAGESFLQLLRPVGPGGDGALNVATQVRRWPGVLSVSCWETVANAPHTDRSEVVHLRDAELIHAELAADDVDSARLIDHASKQLPGWDAAAYRHRASRTTSPS